MDYKKLKAARRNAGFSADDVAVELKVDRATVFRWEAGPRRAKGSTRKRRLNPEMMERLAKLYGCSTLDLGLSR